MTPRSFEIDRKDISRVRFVDDVAVKAPRSNGLAAGEIMLTLERFGLSANNITYALFGEAMRYWDFFPATEPGWGRVPVWGFGVVTASNAAGVAVGERVYGYFPLAERLVVRPDKISPAGFIDSAAHRAPLPAVYNRYVRTSADPVYDAGFEDAHMLLHPLFMTSWLLEDFLNEARDFGAQRLVVTSASSKTAIGLADQVKARNAPDRGLVGLTSASNVGAVTALGLYDQVVSYDDLAALEPDAASVIVDFAGSQALTRTLYARLTDIRRTVLIGAAQGDLAGGGYGDLSPKPQFFFAPDQVRARSETWGPHGLMERYGADWRRFRDASAARFDVRAVVGEDAIAAVFKDLAAGRVAARDAFAARWA